MPRDVSPIPADMNCLIVSMFVKFSRGKDTLQQQQCIRAWGHNLGIIKSNNALHDMWEYYMVDEIVSVFRVVQVCVFRSFQDDQIVNLYIHMQ